MRIILTIFTLFYSFLLFAQTAPVKGKGQAQATYQTIERLETPNSGVTVTADKAVLLEGDPENLLVNPGFEHQTFGTGWTVNAGTATVDTTNFYDGKKSMSIALTAVTGDILTQCVTPTGQKGGTNMSHSLRVKTTLSNLQVCSVLGSTEQQCVSASNIDSWVEILATSVATNGTALCVKLKSTSSATGTVKVDSGYVGKSRNIGSVANAKNVVNFVWTGTLTATHDNDILFTWSGATQNKLENMTHSSGVFTVTVPGDYQVKFCPRLDTNAGSASLMRGMIAKVYKNSTTTPLDASGYIHGLAQNNINGGGEPSTGFYANPPPCVVNTTTYAIGDTLRFKGYQANGSGTNFSWIGGVLEINYFPPTQQQAVNASSVKQPTVTRITSGSGTYTVPSGVTSIRVKMTGGGGGGMGGNGTTCSAGSNGASTTFGNATAALGLTGVTQGACFGQSLTSNSNTITGAISIVDSITNCGQGGSGSTASGNGSGGMGGSNYVAIGGAGSATEQTGAAGKFGGGGGGPGTSANVTFIGCSGGNSGGYLEFLVPNPAPTYSYSVGAGGAGGVGGRTTGGAGGTGIIIIEEYYGYNAPIIIGSVTSNSPAAERVERANVVNNGTTCTASSPGNAISCSFTLTGRCTCTFSPAFSSGVVTCIPVANFSSGVNQITCTNTGTPSTSTVIVDCKNNLSDANFDFGIICMGPR